MPRMHAPNALIRALTFAVATTAVTLPTLVAHAQDAVQWRVEDGGNGHWYQVVSMDDTLCWEEARAFANALGGYLATPVTAEEDLLLRSLLEDVEPGTGTYIGGFQDFESPEYDEPSGGWAWLSGEPWTYQNWHPSEPGNDYGGEDFLAADFNGPAYGWFDIGGPDAPQGPCNKSVAAVEWSADCNEDGIVDYGQILDGTFSDDDGNGVPDICEPAQWRVEDGGNGHWYLGIAFGEAVGWEAARESALQLGGDLIATENAEEKAWMFREFSLAARPDLYVYNGEVGPYIGASQASGSTEPAAGWEWVSGVSFDPSADIGCCNDDCNGLPEDVLHLSTYTGGWNDTPGNPSETCIGSQVYSAIIEWSVDCNDDGIVDYGQILDGSLGDVNQNGVPDSCEVIHVPDDVATIQGAIDVAPPGSTVRIAAGTYLLESTIDLLGKSLTIQGEMDADGTPLTVLDGQDVRRVLACTSGETASCVIERLVVAHGSALGGFGGGLLVDDASPTIRDCVFRDNSAEYGGAIACDNGAAPHVSNCRILQNDGKDGGGIYLEFGSTILLESSIVGGNLATEQGGGIHIAYQSDAEIHDSRIEANETIGTQGRDGGGIYCVDSTLVVSGTDFVQNTCATSSGGAAMFIAQSTVDLDRCLFDGNSGPAGGAIYASDGSMIDGRSVHFRFNTANSGGAIFSISDATVHLSGGAFEGNTCPPYPQGNAWEHFASGGSRSIDDFLFLEDQNLWLNPGGIVVSNSTFCGVGPQGDDGGGNIVEPTCELGDCDGDGVPDFIEVLQGASDCDGNGIPDDCDLNATYAASEPRTPTNPADLLTFDVSGLPDAREDVTLEISALGDLDGPANFLLVYLDEATIENRIGIVFNATGGFCVPNTETISIPAATWNAAGTDGERSIILAGTALSPDACPDPYTAIDVSVPIIFEDCNTNGLWDACEIADGAVSDTDEDGVIDDCDGCPNDPDKTEPGNCGCGTPETGDRDGDGLFDCVDPCPDWPYDCSKDGQTIFVAVGQPIQQAIDLVPAGGVVELGAGTFQPVAPLNPSGRAISIIGTVDADGMSLTTLDGQETNQLFICNSGEGLQTMIANLVFVDGWSGPDGFGGGMRLEGSSPTIRNCRFERCLTPITGSGGAISCRNGSSPSIESCDFVENQSSAIYCYRSDSRPNINLCHFDGNSSEPYQGGAIYCSFHASATITECSFENNVATFGGAIYPLGSVIDRCDFTGNAAQSGGAIHCQDGDPIITECHFEGNSTFGGNQAYGGAIRVIGGSTPIIETCVFTNNTAFNGGGLQVSSSAPVVRDCTFQANSASNGGGGLSNFPNGNPTVIRCTFESNIADTGGGAANSSNSFPIYEQCVFTGNEALGIVVAPGAGAMYSNSGSIPSISDSTICGNTQPGVDQIIGSFTDLGGNCISEFCDRDSDGTLDCNDGCPLDPDKTEPGQCGCDVEDIDTDEDGIADCVDPCPLWPYDCSEDGSTLLVSEGQSIQQAIDVANDGDTIEVSAGTYPGAIISLDRTFTLRGEVGSNGELLVTIDAQQQSAAIVCNLGGIAVFEDLRITGGRGVDGGGVRTDFCSPEFTRCVIEGNLATGRGGGVFVRAGSPVFRSCLITNNVAEGLNGQFGGGIATYGLDGPATPRVQDTLIFGNSPDQVADLEGGAWVDEGGNCIVSELGDDVDGNGVPDSCDPDCNENGIPDGLDADCDGNGVPDECEIADGVAEDCNENGVPDACDLANGTSDDDNGNEIPDACDLARGDLSLDGCIDAADLGLLIALWGLTDPPIGDLNGDGLVDAADLGLLISNWSPCLP